MHNKQMKLDMPDSADRRRVGITIDELDVSTWASRAWKEQTFAASAGGRGGCQRCTEVTFGVSSIDCSGAARIPRATAG
jgi:hypothetical protein